MRLLSRSIIICVRRAELVCIIIFEGHIDIRGLYVCIK